MSLDVLFVHRSFPAQFGRLAEELAGRYGWRCHFLVEKLSHCPPPSAGMLRDLDVRQWPRSPNRKPDAETPWPQIHAQALECARAVFDAVRARPELKPDLVVGHGGLVPTLLLSDLLDCPLVDYCEYYFAPHGKDLTYRVDLPAVEPSAFFPRCINAATLLSLTACDAGYTPTHFQRNAFPERFRSKIEVHPDGIDTELYRPNGKPSLAGFGVPDGARVVTYVARGLESVRGFDLFVRLAERVGAVRPDVHFVVVGGTDTHYGWDPLFTGGRPFKDWVMERFAGDRSRVHFPGMVDPAVLADVLARSDLHVYLSVPFVASWSLLNALSAGCVVLTGDVESVREFVEPDRTGLLAPLFDVEEQTRLALAVLDEPAKYGGMRAAARRLVVEKYSIDAAVPGLREFFERVASKGRRSREPLPPAPSPKRGGGEEPEAPLSASERGVGGVRSAASPPPPPR